MWLHSVIGTDLDHTDELNHNVKTPCLHPATHQSQHQIPLGHQPQVFQSLNRHLPTCLFFLCPSFSTLNRLCEIVQNLFLLQDLRVTLTGICNVNIKSKFISLVSKILSCLPIIVLAHSLLMHTKIVDQQRTFLLS